MVLSLTYFNDHKIKKYTIKDKIAKTDFYYGIRKPWLTRWILYLRVYVENKLVHILENIVFMH